MGMGGSDGEGKGREGKGRNGERREGRKRRVGRCGSVGERGGMGRVGSWQGMGRGTEDGRRVWAGGRGRMVKGVIRAGRGRRGVEGVGCGVGLTGEAMYYVVATVINARFVFMESISKQPFRKNQKTSSAWNFVAVVDFVKRGVLTTVSEIQGHRNYRYYYRSHKGEQIH